MMYLALKKKRYMKQRHVKTIGRGRISQLTVLGPLINYVEKINSHLSP